MATTIPAKAKTQAAKQRKIQRGVDARDRARRASGGKTGADTPMKRPAQPEEIAPAYAFLASPQMSGYVTGEILPIVGGY